MRAHRNDAGEAYPDPSVLYRPGRAMLHTNKPRHAFAMREHWSSVAPSAGSAQGFCASGCGCQRGR